VGLKPKSTAAEELEKLIDSGTLDDDIHSIVQDILTSKNYGTLASRYGLKFIENFLEMDGNVSVIYGDYQPIGAETGRTACKNPNMQNIPARDTKIFRECFIARPGHKLIIADFSSQEPYISAVVSGEPKLIEWIQAGKDIYIEVAREVFGKTITKGDPERQHMKSIILGGNYGMSKYGLARKLNCTPDEAQALINKTHKVLPVLAKYMERQRQETTQVFTPFGRKIWLNPYSYQTERNALNAPIQGGAGDQMKASLGKLYANWDQHFFVDFPVVGYIHDELVSDVEEEHAEAAAEFIKTTLENTATEMVNGIIRFKVDVHIGDSWAEKG
jgi:DNA polymerase I